MKIYLDSAQVPTWTLPAGCPAVQGVTTNPSLVFQAGLPVTLASYLGLVQAAADHGFAELMLQLPSADLGAAIRWVDTLRTAADGARVQLTIKLPCAAEWEPCIRQVQQVGQAILLTGLSNPVQLLWARDMHAQYVAPYVGRLANDGRNVWALMQACVALQSQGPQLLAASIKSPEVLAQLIGIGAAAVTLPPASLVAWSTDTLTQAAMAQFDQDIAASLASDR
ncbi:transaldolase family protein [Rhodoferax saidenbachensis]|uniref:Transaldolase n=1 Tax=Rhodoferax saidenbachensis TaxID=1484693 RepID=A0ABU1ZPT7_9BURK|nr:transaldolase family protein [Rhodoferax saidenbachensis]MDR7306541.1 transaldolase [Rhodoferax saidenbachensis]